jgi:hypothetical protein
VVNDAKFQNKGWEIESSLNLNQQLITNVILSGGQYFGGRGFGGGIAVAPPADPSLDYLPQGSADAGADSGTFQTAEEVRTADIKALFTGLSGSNVRVTRIRSDIAHSAMTADLVFQASADQSELSNVRTVTKSVNLVCPTYPPCPNFSGANYGGSTGSNVTPGSGASSGTGRVVVGASGGSGNGSSGTVTAATGGDSGSSSTGAASSGSTASGAALASTASSSHSCVASPQSGRGVAAGFGATAGLLGLAAVRKVRARRRARGSRRVS